MRVIYALAEPLTRLDTSAIFAEVIV